MQQEAVREFVAPEQVAMLALEAAGRAAAGIGPQALPEAHYPRFLLAPAP
jgi:hypothetical protein